MGAQAAQGDESIPREHPTFAKIRNARQYRGVELSTLPMIPEDILILQNDGKT